MLVVAGEGWHRGVIGIVASKIVDAFYRPTIVLSIDDGIAHGSCRSIPGFDMLAALESCAPMLLRFGGHKQAAGLQIESRASRSSGRRSTRMPMRCLGPDDLRPRLWLDGPLAFGDITDRVMAELSALAPFGPGNPKPRVPHRPVSVVDGPRRLKDRHLKMSVKQDGRVLRAIQWNAAEREEALTVAEGRRRARVHPGRERVPGQEVRGASRRRLPLNEIRHRDTESQRSFFQILLEKSSCHRVLPGRLRDERSDCNASPWNTWQFLTGMSVPEDKRCRGASEMQMAVRENSSSLCLRVSVART